MSQASDPGFHSFACDIPVRTPIQVKGSLHLGALIPPELFRHQGLEPQKLGARGVPEAPCSSRGPKDKHRV